MSGLIPRSFIDELLARSDLVEVIDTRVPLRKTGINYSACCPFHSEKSPSFTVSPAKQFYHCFGCGVSGNAISFLMEYDRLDFVSAIETLAAQLGMSVPREATSTQAHAEQVDLYALLEHVAEFYQQQLRRHPVAIDYLKQRGLSGKTAKHFKIGYAPEGWDHVLKQWGTSKERQAQLLSAGMLIKKEGGGYYDRFRDRVMFPIRDRRGRVIGFGGRVIGEGIPKYLNSPETPIFHKGKELYGLYEARQAERDLQRLLVVEGYMDVVMLAERGIRYAVATLGTATSTDHLHHLFRTAKEIIFCFDGDAAGKAAAWRALETTLPVLEDSIPVRFLFLPEGEDPDSLVRSEGASNFEQRMTHAVSLADYLFSHLMVDIDFSEMEGKARFVKLVEPLIKKIPSDVLRHMMLERLAQIVRIDSEKLPSLLGISFKAPSAARVNRAPRQATPSLMRQAIALLLQNPSLSATLTPETLQHLTISGAAILKQLLELLQSNSELTTGALLEHWRDRKEFSQLSKLAAWQHHIPHEGVTTEFASMIQGLLKQQQTEQVEQLLRKAHYEGLDETEKRQLQALISTDKLK